MRSRWRCAAFDSWLDFRFQATPSCDPLAHVRFVLLWSWAVLLSAAITYNCAWRDHGPRAQVPIIAQVKTRKLEVLEREPLATHYSNEFLAGLMTNPELVRNVAVVGHLHHGKTIVRASAVLRGVRAAALQART